MKAKAEQQRLYGLLPQGAFLRICRDDRAMWISNWPAKTADVQEILFRLNEMGFAAEVDGGLCRMDWSEEAWQQLLKTFDATLPPLPVKEKYHQAYALCRFWLLHPQPFAEEVLPVLRKVIKLAEGPEEQLLAAVKPLHEQAAMNWRETGFCAHAAGLVLAAWLKERSE